MRRVVQAVAVALCCVILVSAMPHRSEHPQQGKNSKFLAAAERIAGKAEADLKEMHQLELDEQQDMLDMKDAVDKSLNPLVPGEVADEGGDTAEKVAYDALKKEDKQQNKAVDALHKVSMVVHAFKTAGVQELGETRSDIADQRRASQHAVKEFKEVEGALKQETAVSKTRKKIEKLAWEAHTLQTRSQRQTSDEELKSDNLRTDVENAELADELEIEKLTGKLKLGEKMLSDVEN